LLTGADAGVFEPDDVASFIYGNFERHRRHPRLSVQRQILSGGNPEEQSLKSRYTERFLFAEIRSNIAAEPIVIE